MKFRLLDFSATKVTSPRIDGLELQLSKIDEFEKTMDRDLGENVEELHEHQALMLHACDQECVTSPH